MLIIIIFALIRLSWKLMLNYCFTITTVFSRYSLSSLIQSFLFYFLLFLFFYRLFLFSQAFEKKPSPSASPSTFLLPTSSSLLPHSGFPGNWTIEESPLDKNKTLIENINDNLKKINITLVDAGKKENGEVAGRDKKEGDGVQKGGTTADSIQINKTKTNEKLNEKNGDQNVTNFKESPFFLFKSFSSPTLFKKSPLSPSNSVFFPSSFPSSSTSPYSVSFNSSPPSSSSSSSPSSSSSSFYSTFLPFTNSQSHSSFRTTPSSSLQPYKLEYIGVVEEGQGKINLRRVNITSIFEKYGRLQIIKPGRVSEIAKIQFKYG